MIAIPARTMFLLIAEGKQASVNIGDTTHPDSALLQTISLDWSKSCRFVIDEGYCLSRLPLPSVVAQQNLPRFDAKPKPTKETAKPAKQDTPAIVESDSQASKPEKKSKKPAAKKPECTVARTGLDAIAAASEGLKVEEAAAAQEQVGA